MNSYYVNNEPQSGGEHAVHKEGCSFMPPSENRTYLGVFVSGHGAVMVSKRDHYEDSYSCWYCCGPCNSR